MKKLLLLLSIVGTSVFTYAQENEERELNYNKWSIEVGGGANKATSAFTPGYHSETPDFYNANVGVRYMFNNKFGLKLSGNYDRLKEGKDSKDFESDLYRIDLSGVANLGRVLNFEDWTNTIGLLAHAGAGVGFLKNDAAKTDEMGLVTLGLTPQVKLSNRFVLTGDLSYTKTIRQNTTWDGQSKTGNSASGFDGSLWNASLGLTFYFGGNKKHADWTYETSKKDLENRISNIELMLKDSDNDGVADYLDQEPNSAPGAVVDTKGITIDNNGNGIPDNIEEYIKQNTNNGSVSDADFLEQMINSGIINTYFDYNSDQPYNQSVGGLRFVSDYLKAKPEAKIEILGYADPVGGAAYNKELSKRRAENVKNILIKNGAKAEQLTTVAEGLDSEFKNSPSSSHQLARRVIFKVK